MKLERGVWVAALALSNGAVALTAPGDLFYEAPEVKSLTMEQAESVQDSLAPYWSSDVRNLYKAVIEFECERAAHDDGRGECVLENGKHVVTGGKAVLRGYKMGDANAVANDTRALKAGTIHIKGLVSDRPTR